MTYKIVTTKWGRFFCVAGIIYLYHLVAIMAGCNAYSDYTRLIPCGEWAKKPITGANLKSIQEDSSSVYDAALMIAIIYHIIEWVRWTLFITTALVNVNLLKVYTLLGINFLLGFVNLCAACAARFSENGNACAEQGKQQSRGLYLLL